jgi:two-component system sensor histidine kinase/response regulator
VLMDVQMPEMGGFEATAAIRAREAEEGGHLRIVAMTAHALKGDRERCLAAGMDGYLAKPIDRAELIETVEDGSTPPASFAPPPSARPGSFDHADAIERLGGDDELLLEIVRVFVDEAPRLLRQIDVAVGAGDPDRLSAAAHELKGAAANLSATGVAQAASALEQMARQRRFEQMLPASQRLQAEMQALDIVLNQFLTEASSCAS